MENTGRLYLRAGEIDRLLETILQASDFLRRLADGTDALASSLIENKQMRESAKSGAQPLDWETLVEDVATRDSELGQALRLARVERFDHPRIWLNFDSVPDELRGTVAFRLRPYLETYTAAKYGKKFRIRVNYLT